MYSHVNLRQTSDKLLLLLLLLLSFLLFIYLFTYLFIYVLDDKKKKKQNR